MRFGMALAVALLVCGCASERVALNDRNHPDIRITAYCEVTWRGKTVDVRELPKLLKKAGYTRNDTINVQVADGITDRKFPYTVLYILGQGGFPRPILVSERHASSTTAKPAGAAPDGGPSGVSPSPKRKVTYK